MNLRFVVFLVCLSAFSLSAQNLVPNPSFENINHCPINQNDYAAMQNWYRACITSSDFYNACAEGNGNYQGVPTNFVGVQPAQDGNGYAGIVLFYVQPNYREYIGIKLQQKLAANKRYCLDFYVALADSGGVRTGSIGAYFGDSLYHTFSNGPHNVTPQIQNPESNYIDDLTNWKLISGSYVAQGGEEYLTIGNFFDDGNTIRQQAVYMPGLPVEDQYYTQAYVYIDNVSLYMCDSITGIDEDIENNIKIFPNPANEYIAIDAPKTYTGVTVKLYNAMGALVHLSTLNTAEKPKIDVSALANGIYIAKVESGNKVLICKKVLINR